MFTKTAIALLALTAGIFHVQKSQAAWNEQSVQWAKSFNSEKIKFADPDMMTVWAGFKSAHVSLYKTVKKMFLTFGLNLHNLKTVFSFKILRPKR